MIADAIWALAYLVFLAFVIVPVVCGVIYLLTGRGGWR